MVKIRLRRMGLRSRPTYRVVAIDSRRARDGKYLESVGNYDPRSKQLDLDMDRVNHWLSRGAEPSDTVGRLIRRYAKQHAPVPEPAAPDQKPALETPPAEAPAATASTETPNQGVSREGTD